MVDAHGCPHQGQQKAARTATSGRQDPGRASDLRACCGARKKRCVGNELRCQVHADCEVNRGYARKVAQSEEQGSCSCGQQGGSSDSGSSRFFGSQDYNAGRHALKASAHSLGCLRWTPPTTGHLHSWRRGFDEYATHILHVIPSIVSTGSLGEEIWISHVEVVLTASFGSTGNSSIISGRTSSNYCCVNFPPFQLG